MKSVFAIALAVCLLGAVAVVSAADDHVLYERTNVPKLWAMKEQADAAMPIKFIVAVKQQGKDVLDKEFEARTNPDSPKWTQWLEIEDIAAIVKPKAEHHATVMAWLTNAGVRDIKDHGDAIEAVTTIAIATTLFNTRFHIFVHQDGRKLIKAWGRHHVPAAVGDAIDFVEGVSNFPVPHFGYVAQKAMTDGTERKLKQFSLIAYVPESTDIFYNKGRDESNESGTQAVIEFQGQSYSPQELKTFAQQMNLPISQKVTVVGPNAATSPQTEATLDIQWMAGTNNGAQNWFWLEPGNDWLFGFATHFFGTKTVPLVNSISYGWAEDDQCTIAPTECGQLGVNSQQYVARVNTEFQKIGLRGVTLMAASGDSGANGRSDPLCSEPKLAPGFPGASPYVTTVGATQMNNPVTKLPTPPPACTTSSYTCVSGGDEAAVSYATAQFASGGGFSNFSPRPSYQEAAVKQYLSGSGATLPPATYFNANGRGYPDIASLGTSILIYTGGSLQPVGGTSAASPTVAGIMGLLNSHKIKKTGTPLGPLNPFLYKMAADHATAFHDIVVGDNKCTEQGCQSSCEGYECAKGWDPVTGLGSPDYKEMKAYLDTVILEKGMLLKDNKPVL